MADASAFSTRAVGGLVAQRLGGVLRTLTELPGPRRFLVGGPVRDLLLRRPFEDLDLAIEGDAEGFVERAAEALGGRLTGHPRFHTWRLDLSDGQRVDFAALRREHYPAPGRLPEVVRGDLAADLKRRDFTVNAMALELSASSEGRLHDPFGGQEDLRAGRLRVLHERSFDDDPTRLWRAARFAARLKFHLEPESARWARRAVDGGALDTLSGKRLAREIEKLFEDDGGDHPGSYATAANSLGLWQALHPRWGKDLPSPGELDLAARRWRTVMPTSPSWTLPFGALLDRLPMEQASALTERLAVSGTDSEELLSRPEPDLLQRLEASGRHFGAILLSGLGDLPTAARVRLWARGGPLRRWVEIFEQGPTPTVTGADLIAAGAEPGPALGQALEQTHGALLEGRIGPGDDRGVEMADEMPEEMPDEMPRELAYALRIWKSLA